MGLYYVNGEFGCSGCANGCSECDGPPPSADEVMARLRAEWEREDRRRELALVVERPAEARS